MSIRNILTDIITYKQSLYRSHKSALILKDIDLPPITKEQKKIIKSVWGEVKIDTRWFAYFNMYRTDDCEWTPLFIPDNLHYGIIDLYYSNYRKSRIIEDKNLNNLLYSEIYQPETVLRKISNRNGYIFLDKDYHIISENQVLNLLSDGNIIVKPSIDSGGGKGVNLFLDSNNEKEILKHMQCSSDFIVQKIAKQHETMSALNESSLNTMRLITFIHKDGVHILSAVARMGSDKSHLDNASSGGIFCGINNNGTLKSTAYNLKLDKFDKHPNSRIVFKDYNIPGYKECCDIVTSLAPKFYGFSRLISWDLAIGIDGIPMLIEANMTFGGVDIPQIANGPLFGDLTNEVIKEIFSDKKNIWLSRFI